MGTKLLRGGGCGNQIIEKRGLWEPNYLEEGAVGTKLLRGGGCGNQIIERRGLWEPNY